MSDLKKLDDHTLKVTTSLSEGSSDWGTPRLVRIFNFKAAQVTTIYERGGLKSYLIPRGDFGSSETAYTAAVTSAMQVQNFRDIENTAEIAELHQQFEKIGGHPPPLDDLLPGLGKKTPRLSSGNTP